MASTTTGSIVADHKGFGSIFELKSFCYDWDKTVKLFQNARNSMHKPLYPLTVIKPAIKDTTDAVIRTASGRMFKEGVIIYEHTANKI